MMTQKETVRVLCKSILTRLENNKSIEFAPRLRNIVQDEVMNLVKPHVYTEEDLREKTLQSMGQRAEQLSGTDFAESDQFKAAKAVIKKTFGDDVLNGLYFQQPLKRVAELIVGYLMRSSHIDEVYETDADLERQIVEIVKTFNPSHAH